MAVAVTPRVPNWRMLEVVCHVSSESTLTTISYVSLKYGAIRCSWKIYRLLAKPLALQCRLQVGGKLL